MMHPDFHDSFVTERPLSEEGVLSDFQDGLRSQTHRMRPHCQKYLIGMLLYYDDIELANPLGMKTGRKGKLTVLCVSFLNLSQRHRCHLRNIFLLGIGHATVLKSVASKKRLLQEAFSTINTLSTSGVEFATKSSREVFHGCLVGFAGDALACHSVMGFEECFSPSIRRPCSVCYEEQINFPSPSFHGEYVLRTDYEIARPVRAIQAAPTRAE